MVVLARSQVVAVNRVEEGSREGQIVVSRAFNGQVVWSIGGSTLIGRPTVSKYSTLVVLEP